MKRRPLLLIGLLAAGLFLTLILSHMIAQSTADNQVRKLNDILRNSTINHLTSQDLLKKVSENNLPIDVVEGDSEQIVVIGEPVVSILGQGSRWLVWLNIDEKDRIVAFKVEIQAIGYY